ncbi:MAG: peptidoglycan DL-endopeptidase CwlO, partial [Acidimicrobiaceae bacterium]|nr:peptidoglycan DL-endopeptidase CwlO [Acidimicrobiaceae bacterium]
MSGAHRSFIAVGTALAVSLVLAAAPAGAATKPAPTTTTSVTKKTAATKRTAAAASKTATKAATKPLSKTATRSTKKTTAKSTEKTTSTTTTTVSTTPVAVTVRPSTAINVGGIRSAAVAALASRGRPGEAVARARLAAAVAIAEHTASAASLDQAWAHTTATRLVAVYTALAQVGAPYQTFGMAPSGFDCSGLTWFAWQTAGVSLPRTSFAQNAGLRS